MEVAFIDSVHPVLWERLTQAGFHCLDLTKAPKEEVLARISDVHGVVIRSRIPMDETHLQGATQLRFIARSGAGLENIDLDYCNRRGIITFNAPEGNRQAVGEHALGMILCLFNKLHTAKGEIGRGLWDREGNRGHELEGKTVGIIGFGNNGSAFGRVLAGFQVRVLAYDKYDQSFIDDCPHVRAARLEEIQETADVISFHTPLTQETNKLYNLDFINACARPHYLINVARGPVVVTADLVQGMKKGKVLGACLDVLEYESTSFENWLKPGHHSDDFQYLLDSSNCVLSPHVAGWSHESYEKLSNVLANKILSTPQLLPG